MPDRPIVLVTGASRRAGIGAAIAIAMARSGWDVATTHWRAYDDAMPWGRDKDAPFPNKELTDLGAKTVAIEADLGSIDRPAAIFDEVNESLGPVTALVMAHCHSVAGDILTTSSESFDQHFLINVKAGWLLIREFGSRYSGVPGDGRIIALTSDHVVGNLAYGSSKGALDRIVLAAAEEFADKAITANVINPGPTDTGWMTDQQKKELSSRSPLGRVGTPEDCARLVAFLCSSEGAWITGQLIHSNGGFR